MDSTEENKENKDDKKSLSLLFGLRNNSDVNPSNQQANDDGVQCKSSYCCFPLSSSF